MVRTTLAECDSGPVVPVTITEPLPVTTAITEADVDGWLRASPLYCAEMWSIPTVDKVICACAAPLVMGRIVLPTASKKVIVPVSGFEEVTVAVAEIEPFCGTLLVANVMAILVGTAGTCVIPPPPTVVVEPPPQPSAATIAEHAPRAARKR